MATKNAMQCRFANLEYSAFHTFLHVEIEELRKFFIIPGNQFKRSDLPLFLRLPELVYKEPKAF